MLSFIRTHITLKQSFFMLQSVNICGDSVGVCIIDHHVNGMQKKLDSKDDSETEGECSACVRFYSRVLAMFVVRWGHPPKSSFILSIRCAARHFTALIHFTTPKLFAFLPFLNL